MSNPVIETYTQSFSCFDCHAQAHPQGAPLNSEGFPDPSLQIFTFLLQDAQSSVEP